MIECPVCKGTTKLVLDYPNESGNASGMWEEICGGEHGNYGCDCGTCHGANNYDVDHDHEQFVELEASVYHCEKCRKYLCGDCGSLIERLNE